MVTKTQKEWPHIKTVGQVTVQLRRNATAGSVSVDSRTIPKDSTLIASFRDLSSSKYYYLKFPAPSSFSDTVTGNK